ncbi:hypothetical protein GGI11_003788 [Coemansia sp. RSA 2049]|nr:hypothetical protein GGI11_003788 [Coemansia sp. RSA 2049]
MTDKVPEITLDSADGSTRFVANSGSKRSSGLGNNSNRSSSSAPSSHNSPALSYLHTPAEPYDGEAVANSSQMALAQFLQTTGLESQPAAITTTTTNTAAGSATQDGTNYMTPEAVAASLQAEISTATMSHGSIWYLVSRGWYAAWQEYASGLVQDRTIGPIDNTAIADDAGNMLPGLTFGEDVDAVPAAAWSKLVNLYGVTDARRTVRRMAIQANGNGTAVLELCPPSVFVAPRARDDTSVDHRYHNHNTQRIEISLDAPVVELKRRIAHAFGLSDESSVSQLKLFYLGRPAAHNSSSSSMAEGHHQDPPSYETAVAAAEEPASASGSPQPLAADDSQSLVSAGILPDTAIVFEATGSAGDAATKSAVWQGPVRGSGLSNAMVLAAEPVEQTHYQCGLVNLGNTCYMNSALQCLGHFSDLAKYFVSGAYTREVNRDNPLGIKGALASSYGRLAKAMWDVGHGSFAPRVFKQMFGQWAPAFRGYNQQDAHEFLNFFLDGMHEDLNRIVHKPYNEIPDVNGRPDAEVADERWRLERQREDSVIFDLFRGQYRSTLVCPVCDNVSVIFDPLMDLSLSLPVQRQKWLEVLFLPADAAFYPLHMRLLVKDDHRIEQLRQLVGYLTQCDPSHLLVCEILATRIYSIYDDSDSLGDISEADTVYIYELGIDATKTTDDPASTQLPVVQLLCSSSSRSNRYTYGPDIFSKPLLLTLPAHDLALGEVYRAVALGLSRWATLDMSAVVAELDAALDGSNNNAGLPLLALLSRAASLSIHRAEPAAGMQQRNLSYISSYMNVGGRRGFGPTTAFRAFEDRLSYDNCVPLVGRAAAEGQQQQQQQQEQQAAASSTSISGDEPMSAGSSEPASASVSDECSGRRRARPIDDADAHPIKGARVAVDQAVSKRARSDTGSDCEGAKDPVDEEGISPSFVSAAESLALVTPQACDTAESGANPSLAASTHASVSGSVSSGSATPTGHSHRSSRDVTPNHEIANDGDSVPSLEDLLHTRVQLKTGDTLLCEWNDDALGALAAALQGATTDTGRSDAPDGVVASTSAPLEFDFERRDSCTMQALEDASQFTSVTPFGLTALSAIPRVADDPTAHRARAAAADQRRITLDDCFATSMQPEKLGEADAWYCSTCKKHQLATKTLDIWRAPEIVVVHLKRFKQSRSWHDKLDTYVDFPVTGLDLTSRVAGPMQNDADGNSASLVYDLHGVCNHFGGLGGGHYTAYARSPEDDKWYEFNDSRVTEVADPEEVKTSAAYLLFYRRRPPAGSAMTPGAAKIEALVADYLASGGGGGGGDLDDGADRKMSVSTVSLPHRANSEMETESEGGSASDDAADFAHNIHGMTSLGLANRCASTSLRRGAVGDASEMDDDDDYDQATPQPQSSTATSSRTTSIDGRADADAEAVSTQYLLGPEPPRGGGGHPFLN